MFYYLNCIGSFNMHDLDAKHMMRLRWHAQSIKDDKVYSEAYRSNKSMYEIPHNAMYRTLRIESSPDTSTLFQRLSNLKMVKCSILSKPKLVTYGGATMAGIPRDGHQQRCSSSRPQILKRVRNISH